MAATDPAPDHLVLAEGDNIAVALRPLQPGHTVTAGGRSVALSDAIAPGHKFALHDIPAGAQVIKYTVPIGVATCDIRPGESVHTHNLRSAYLPTYILGDTAPAAGEV